MTAGEADLPSRLGRYELITRIGQGGMADVQLALQRGPMGFEKLVVVKLVHERLASEKSFVDMLLDEARLAALLKHPNVVDIYDLGEVEGRYFIAMEYLEGEPLLAVLRAGRDGQRLDVNSTARLIADTAEGLDAAHELRSMAGKPLELVHHDVSLGNIVVLYNGHVKLVDFGVAKATQSVSTRAKVQGKFSYMAPEKLRGSEGDRRSDLFSLGCVLWEALTLRRLFKGNTDEETMEQVLEADIPLPSEVNGEVGTKYDAIVMRALQRDEAQRYPTAKELAEDLEKVLHDEGYARKNDAIAKYMQVTFKDRIDARKKLLQEVSSKGEASAAVLQAAFAAAPTVILTGAELGEFAIKFRDPPEIAAIEANGTPANPPFELDHLRTTDHRPRVETPTGSAPLEELSNWQDPNATDRAVHASVVAAPDRKKLYMIGGCLLGSILLIAIVASVRKSDVPSISVRAGVTGGSATAGSGRFGSNALAIPVPDAGIAAVGSTDPSVGPVTDIHAGESGHDGSVDNAIEIEPDRPTPVVGSGAVKKPPDRTAADVSYRLGLQAYVRGDNKGALEHLRRAQQQNPTFAPTWRNLGFVYERIGEVPQARIAFVRYLQLAPSASDAPMIRLKLEKLGK